MASTKKAPQWEADAEEGPASSIGATLVRPNERVRPVSDLKFHIYSSVSNPRVFLILASPLALEKAPKPKRGEWYLFKIVPEIGRPRIGFSEEEAKDDIAKQGYHLIGVSIRSPALRAAAVPKRRIAKRS